ncbi:heterokaryon incompatibility protein-domain-containing protein, partial [Tricladium varicosporioides]
YIALSYCWGVPNDSRPLLKTTRSTKSSRIAGIPVEDMPLAFQDAVKLARTLNIPYLWIDSLCITQDDAQDWQNESSRMAEIFSHAYLTVVAAIGASCHDSFLWRDPNCASVSIPCTYSKSGSINGQIELRFRREWAATDKMSQISRHRWVTRGWTFQEERLARRVLMFGEDKFFFDCRTAERCEDTDRLRPRPDWVDTVYGEPEPSDAEPSALVRRQTYSLQRAPYDHWQTLCNHYTRRALTYEGDKLPALEGMASQIAKKVHSEYLAGLWKDNLAHDLFWQTQRRATKPQAYRAPSWSWAALEGHVRWSQWPSW